MTRPRRRTILLRPHYADNVNALRQLGFVRIPDHGWFIDDETAHAICDELRDLDALAHQPMTDDPTVPAASPRPAAASRTSVPSQ